MSDGTGDVAAPPRRTPRLERYLAGLWLHMRGKKPEDEGGSSAAEAPPESPPAWERRYHGDPMPEVPGAYLEAEGDRRADVDRFAAAMADPSVAVVGLTGHTGIGKTALVTHLLEVRERFGKAFVVWFDANMEVDPLRNDALYLSGEMLEARPHLATKANAVPGGKQLGLADFLEQDCLLVLDNLEYRLEGSAFRQTQNPTDRDAFLAQLLKARAQNRGQMKLLLISWQMPLLPNTPKIREVRLDSGLTEEQSRLLLMQYAAGREAAEILNDPAQAGDVNRLISLCDGIPSALVTAVAFLNLPGKRTVARLLKSPWFMDPGLDLEARLRRCVQSVVTEAKQDARQRVVLLALVLLGAPFSAESEEDGVAKMALHIAAAEGLPLTLDDVRVALHRLTPGFAHSWEEPREDGTRADLYVLNPLFSWAVLENLDSLEADRKADLFTRAADFYGDLLEEYPSRQGAGNLGDFYRFEDTRYQEYLAAYLRVLLLNPRRDTQRTKISIAGVALKIHWWWSIFTPLEALDRILDRIELALTEAQRVRPDEDFGGEKQLLDHLRLLDRTFPREKDWAGSPSFAQCEAVLTTLTAVRQALGCDFERVTAEAEDEQRLYPEADEYDLLDAAALTDMYRGDLYLYQISALGPQEAPERRADLLARARSAKASSRERFTENMTWSVLYAVQGQCAVEFAAGDRAAALAFAREALEKCRASDTLNMAQWKNEPVEGETEERDGKAGAYRVLADGLLDRDPERALKAYRLAHWEAFAYLWDPEKDPPNDNYTVSFYRVACERFAHALRYVAGKHPDLALRVAREVAEFWSAWPLPGSAPDRAIQKQLPKRLAGWTEQERARLARGDAETSALYAALTGTLFPDAPAETDREYATTARAFTLRHGETMWPLRDELCTWLKDEKAAP